MPDNLPELRDIHLPDGVSFFPPAYGWWVIFGTIIGSIMLYRLIKLTLQKSKKRYALKLLKNLHSNSLIHQASSISTILRRICVYKYPEAVVLSGKQWTDFLNSKCKNKLDTKTSDLLLNAPYMQENSTVFSAEDIDKLQTFCRQWIGENL